jgi:hypothetical protein
VALGQDDDRVAQDDRGERGQLAGVEKTRKTREQPI